METSKDFILKRAMSLVAAAVRCFGTGGGLVTFGYQYDAVVNIQ